MIGLVRATVICATLALGLTAAGAADKAFKRDDLAEARCRGAGVMQHDEVRDQGLDADLGARDEQHDPLGGARSAPRRQCGAQRVTRDDRPGVDTEALE